MHVTILVLIAIVLASCTTYQGSEIWKRQTCEQLIDADERARCLEDAMKPEKEYKEELEDAMKG